ncbi:unnamed protein product, partial [Prorocentrum cordatum]
MPRSKPFTVCNECGQWVYDWRLTKQGGRCKCGAWLEPFQSKPPWRSAHYGQQNAGSSAGSWWGPKPGEKDGKVAALDYLAGDVKQLAKEAPDAWQALTKAKGKYQKAQKWPLECEDEVGKGELVKAEEEEFAKATLQTILDFSVDDRLLDANLDDYEDGPEEEEVLAFRAKVEEIQQAGKQCLQNADDAEAELARQQAEVRRQHAEEAKRLRAQAEQHHQHLVRQVEQLPSLRTQLRKKRRKEDGQAAAGEAAKEKPGAQPAAEPAAEAAEPAAVPDPEAAKQRKKELLDYQAKIKSERAASAAKEGSKQGKTASGTAGDRRLFFANVEKSGPQAHKFLNDYQQKHPKVSVVGICETHLLPEKQKNVTIDLDRDGWKCTATAARPSGLSKTGCCGSEMLMARRHLETTSFDHVRVAAQQTGRDDPFLGFVATTIHAK